MPTTELARWSAKPHRLPSWLFRATIIAGVVVGVEVLQAVNWHEGWIIVLAMAIVQWSATALIWEIKVWALTHYIIG